MSKSTQHPHLWHEVSDQGLPSDCSTAVSRQTCRVLLGPCMLSRLLALIRVSRSAADKLLKELLVPSAPWLLYTPCAGLS